MKTWVVMGLAGVMATAAWGDPDDTPPQNENLHGQATVIWQQLSPFHSPYQGTNSLPSVEQAVVSDTYTIYAGFRVNPRLEFYLNPEMAKGAGVGNALGLAGFVNGDVVRNPQVGGDPYAARYFLRYTLPTGPGREKVEDDLNQLAGTRPTDRVVITVGKVGATDIFDLSSYADNTRTQFMNWALINDAAWDYAADTRGYTFGASVEWVHPTWALRAGSYEMPTIANGAQLDTDLGRNRGDNIEGEWDPTVLKGHAPARIRLLEFRNLGFMGTYRLALQQAALSGTTPNIASVAQQANSKYGYGLNVEQALADDGDTGVFARLGWDDGNTESFAYTEADNHMSVGVQVSGRHWNRPQDHWAMAWVDDNISAAHAAYLAAGGLGFVLGDGHLNYGPEEVLETYYNLQASPTVTWALDFQMIRNPGYNHDRGPVNVLGVRFHFQE